MESTQGGSTKPGSVAAAPPGAEDASYDELLRANRRLEAECTRYQELFASGRDACVVTDAKGIVLDANRRAGELLGMPAEALQRKLLIAFVARGDTRSFRSSLARIEELARAGDPVRVRMRARGGGSPFQAVLWIDARGRSSREGAESRASYLWTILAAPRESGEERALHEVLGTVARLARSWPAEAAAAEPPAAQPCMRLGDSVGRAVDALNEAAGQRGVRLVVERGEDKDCVEALASTLDVSIAALIRAALGATRGGAEVRIRLRRHDEQTVLDVHVEGVDVRSIGSAFSVVRLAVGLAADGGRLEVKSGEHQPLLRVRWPRAC